MQEGNKFDPRKAKKINLLE